MAIKVRQLSDNLYEINSPTRTSNITTDELTAVHDYLGPTTECTFKGRNYKHVSIDRYGQDDYGVWFTDTPSDDTSGCSTRGPLEAILDEVRDELPPKYMTNSERLETLGCIIDIFEDFLEEKGIDIPNDEKEQDDDAAIIYGTDYDNLSDRLEHILIRLGMM